MADFTADSTGQEVATALHRAADLLADLEPVNTEAGRIVLADARPPRVSGRLAQGLTARASGREVVMASTARHFTFVHWGAPRIHVRAQPFLLAAVRASRAQVVDLYTDHARKAMP